MVKFLLATFVCATLLAGTYATNTTNETTVAPTTASSSNNGTTVSTAGTTASSSGNSSASTASTVTTTLYPGVNNAASKVSAEISCPGNFSAIANQTAFKEEIKPQLASKCGVNLDQVQNVQIKAGSIIISFDVVAGTGGNNPAQALAVLKNLVTSGSLALTSTALGNITANASYIIAFEVTTQAPSTTPSSSLLSCYVCDATTKCNTYQKSCDTMNNCTSGQHCWIDRVKTGNSVSHKRYCGTACTSQYQKEYCVSTSTTTTCRKCCSTANCNVEVLTGGSNILTASWILMLNLLLLTGWLTL